MQQSDGPSSSEDDDFFDFDLGRSPAQTGGDLLEDQDQDLDFEAYFRQRLTPLQLERYDAFKSEGAKIPKGYVRKIVAQAIGGEDMAGGDEVYIVLASVAKVYVAQLVEEAKMVQQQQGEKGALKPGQLKEARERLIEKGQLVLGGKD